MRAAKWSSIVLLFILFLLSVVPVYAGTIVVNSLVDLANLNGVCTLREAITRANAGSDGNDCIGVTAGSNTINLSLSGSYTLTEGISLPTITTDITIQESGGVTAILEAATTSNNAGYRVFFMDGASAHLTLNGVTVRNGGKTVVALAGACIFAGNGGDVTLTGGTVVENCYTSSDGGAIASGSSGSVITITNSTVRNSIAGSLGGGVYGNGVLSVSGSTFSGNRTGATGGGGAGIYYLGSSFSVSDSTFSNNQVIGVSSNVFGGAIYANISSGTATISGSTFSGNSTSNGIGANWGGAIFKFGFGTLDVSDSVFTGNSVSGDGAAGGVLYTARGTLTVTNSRIEGNGSSGTTNGDVLALANTATAAITASCIVNNGDNAISDTDGTIITTATGNWWGTSWGPRILGAPALSGSIVSSGDSITGNGVSAVNVGLTNAGNYSTAPTGNWLTSVPTVAGAQCMSCAGVSGIDRTARMCS